MMLDKNAILKSVHADEQQEQSKKEELELLAQQALDQLETAQDVFDFIEILKALVLTKGLVLL